ncbi:alpha/beta hydrolase [Aquibacillus rhizosphaerae]|uniref:Alpha/beta hydrolase n=1 Tax=Aquibacillus rhizosphaerae TaxID=3051431 RepID=A0ABT7LAD6_9BACI|nr:alpha/beta hydrolase [Aquibacillus sp. LR5S19]MDL4842212.1 alpha/beta hydrolase [Aquibacillus sp. LR5S19]
MKRFIYFAVIIIGILVIAYGLVGNYFYNFALNPSKEKDFLEGNPHLAESEAVSAAVVEASNLLDEEFIEKHPGNKVSITSSDNLALKANMYKNENNNHKWAIVVHGYTGNSTQMTRWIRNFHEKGYSVLAPDLRGHGESEGDYIGMGWHDRLDMLQWIETITNDEPEAEIALLGVSMGGATVMMASGEKLPANVKVIIEDCGYSSVMDVFTYQLDDLFGLPRFPIMNAANTLTNIRAGYDLNEASAIKQVAKSTTPMLFIHGEDDSFVPFQMLDEVYNAADVEKDRLIIPGAGHGEAEKVDPERYWNKVWGFVNKYIS